MPEITPHSTPPETKSSRFRLIDFIVFAVIAVVIVVLSLTLIGKLRLKSEVSGAQVVADRVISDISKQNGAEARSLGDKKFQNLNSTTKLNSIFKSASQLAKGQPTVVRKTVDNTKQAQNVYFIYKYGDKSPYYIRINTSKLDGSDKWQLVGISGNASQAALLK